MRPTSACTLARTRIEGQNNKRQSQSTNTRQVYRTGPRQFPSTDQRQFNSTYPCV
jgi:hypothetical protein